MVSTSPDSANDFAAPQNGSRGEKRKSEAITNSTTSTHTRSKRNRYISIACNECKRRKIKCNGKTPCQRCGNLSLECIYAPNCCTNSLKDSEEFQRMQEHIKALQDQVNALWDNVNDLRNAAQEPFAQQQDSVYPDPPSIGRPLSISRTLPPLISPKRPLQKALPQFHGPTSSTYGFDVARSSLQTIGITAPAAEDGTISRERSRHVSPASALMMPAHPSKDPIWLLDRDEAVRICKLFEEEVHIMYPAVDMEKLFAHIHLLYSFLGSALRTGFAHSEAPGEDAMNDDQTTVLKLVLACGLIIEGQGKSELGQKLFDSARLATDVVLVASISLQAISLIVLTATYHFQRDEEAQAWRFIGVAGRICIEMGLHRRSSLVRSFPSPAEQRDALRLFWVVYALDRRWSFGTGMPFSLQDTDIDSALPEPDDTFPYLKYITKHNKIATKIWQHNLAFESGNTPKTDELSFLDFQILQWYQQLPESLKFYDTDVMREKDISDRGQRRLRFLMYLRKNQARISIYRPIMYSATSIVQNKDYAETLVGIAKDTINVITGVNQTSDIYRTQQTCYNYFLVQALAAIFLAVAHAPTVFCQSTRNEFYAAIDLIRGFSTKSHTSKRLWRTIQGLKEMGDKIGMSDRIGNDQEQDPHANAAMTMAGLSGRTTDGFTFPGRQMRGEDIAVSPEDGQQMGNELTALFELAGAYSANNLQTASSDRNGLDGLSQMGIDGQFDNDAFTAFLGNEPELTRIMNDLF